MIAMIGMRKMTMKGYIIANVIMAAMFVNVLLFGPKLAMGEAFTAGLATGLGTGWLIFAIAGWIELRRPGRAWDERAAAIYTKASAVSFWILLLAVALLAPALRSQTLALGWSAAEVSGTLVNLALAAFGVSAVVFSRIS
jgi:hypothetical protein